MTDVTNYDPDAERAARELSTEARQIFAEELANKLWSKCTTHAGFVSMISEAFTAWAKEREDDTTRLDWLIAEAMYEGSEPERLMILDDTHSVALVIGGGVEWPDGVRARIDTLRALEGETT